MSFHSKSLSVVLEELATDTSRGLGLKEITKRQEKFGKNSLPEAKPSSILKVFFQQFKSPLIYLLFMASLAAYVMNETNDAIVILFVVLINSIIGTAQESKAEKSMADLRKFNKISVRVLRDGNENTINAEELVPGDILLFNPGDAIPADSRIIEAHSLSASEAVLTGESVPVQKSTKEVPEAAPLAERANMLYSGTFINTGRGRAVVMATGLKTEVGQIAKLTETVKEPMTPLHFRIAKFSRYLIYAAAIMFVAIVFVGWIQGITINEIVMIAISQVVSMVPEGLPVALTVAAAVGVQRMASKKTIVRKISAVETLGSTSVICSDKTGTLTLNEMTVTEIMLPTTELIPWNGRPQDDDNELQKLFLIAVLCNDSEITNEKKLGDPTESSLISAAQEIGIFKKKCNEKFPRVNEIPFDSAAKMMATEHRTDEGVFIAIKGATERILELCSNLDESEQTRIREINEQMASQALRVLAFASVEDHKIEDNFDSLKGKATFHGLIGQMDPPRKEVKAAIEACRRAGIRPVMITGDQKATGFAIAKMIGLAQEGDDAIEGIELEKLTTDELALEIKKIAVFARVHPSQKLKLVEAFQKAGHVVAMTGDGVNDAPALGKADVGVAMGITGTEVAKEASKIVVTDDNFSTIVTAIAEGRLVYQNIKKVILLLITTSIAEVAVLLIALVSGFAAPYFAVQILWNNLVTDGVITINLIMDPADGTELDRPPIPRNEPLINKIMLKRLLFIAPAIIFCTFGWYVLRLNMGVDLMMARTETLTMLVVCQWYNALNCRSETQSALSFSIFKNKWLLGGLIVGNILHVLVVYWRPMGEYFHTVPIPLDIIPLIALGGSLVLWVEELRKYLVRRKKHLSQE